MKPSEATAIKTDSNHQLVVVTVGLHYMILFDRSGPRRRLNLYLQAASHEAAFQRANCHGNQNKRTDDQLCH